MFDIERLYRTGSTSAGERSQLDERLMSDWQAGLKNWCCSAKCYTSYFSVW